MTIPTYIAVPEPAAPRAVAASVVAIAIPNIEGKVQTVLGPIEPSELGATLMHEHVFIDIRRPAHNRHPNTDFPEALEPLTLANLGRVRMGTPNEDNAVLADMDEMCAAVLDFKYAGGGAMVEVSSIGLGRDAAALAELSQRTGLHMVMGAGFYEKNFHPADMDARSVDDLADEIVRDITIGVDGTGIRSGVIGEVGIEGDPLTANEIKSVRATGRASARTGCPIHFHVGGHLEEKFDVIDMVEAEGVHPSNIIMGHSSQLLLSLDFARRVIGRGVFVEFDYLGAPGSPNGTLNHRSDYVVAHGVAKLVADGHEDAIVLAHDVCTKLQLKPYGGTGYDYISKHFLPVLSDLGVSDAAIHKIMVVNPARAMAFHAPKL